MEAQAPPAQCLFLYRNTVDNFSTKANSFHWHTVKRNLYQYSEISM